MIAGLVPAAGSSTRMGGPKLLLECEGQPMIARVVRALREGGAARVVVVAPPGDTTEGPPIADQARRAGAEVVVPTARPAEMRDSIELGLEVLARNEPPQRVVLTPGDYPGITREIVSDLLECAARRPEFLVIPCFNGRRGHPIVLPWSIAALISSLPSDNGVNALVARHEDHVVELPIANSAVVADVDTPDELERWRQRDARFPVRVRLFALAKDRAGRSELEIELAPGSKVADVRAALTQRLPGLAPLLSIALIAVNEEYAGDDVPISADSRLAVIPPVSGGAGDCRAFNPSASRHRGMHPQ
jgi:molybdenum cofactor cytidylyltransferase